MLRRQAGLALATCLMLLLPLAVGAQSLAIDHTAVGCIVAGKFPKMNACFSPASSLARARVYFRVGGTEDWYYVEMQSEAPCHTGFLPKPSKDLVGKTLEYYVQTTDRAFAEGQTETYAPRVVASAGDCDKNVPVAPFVSKASVSVFPGLPAGFAAGGAVPFAAAAGIVGGGAGIAGATMLGGEDTTTTTQAAGAGPATTQAATTTTTATTATTTSTTFATATNHPPNPDFSVNPDPPTGQSPLTVWFNMCRSNDPEGDPLSFRFRFGDGASYEGGDCRAEHTYTDEGFGPTIAAATHQANIGVRDPNHDWQTHTYTVTVDPIPTPTPTPTPPTSSSTLFRGPRSTVSISLPEKDPSLTMGWTSELEISGARGQMVVNGASVFYPEAGRTVAIARARRGVNRVEAWLVDAAGAGTWRFDFEKGSLQPGSLRSIAGQVVGVTGDSIVFRLAGTPGERVVFVFQPRR